MQNKEDTNLDLMSLNIIANKNEQLKKIFPEVFAENKIDFEKLKLVLGEHIDMTPERYGLNWAGKRNCFKVIQEPSKGTLRPVVEKSVNFETSDNIFIEGDNLETLKILQKSYFGKIKMIYIDPPYNTGNEFIYPDNYKEELETYLKYSGQLDSEGIKFTTNVETDGRFHSKWLNMMYTRLYLSRNLIAEDGLIAIHIDEHEFTNLEKCLNEIFGEENSLGHIVWDKRNPKGDAKGIAFQHELIFFYAKDIDVFTSSNKFMRPKLNANKILDKAQSLIHEANTVNSNARIAFKEWLVKQDFSGGEKAYSMLDENGDVYRTVSMAWPNKKTAPADYFIPLVHPMTKKPCPIPERGWRNPPETMRKLLEQKLIIFGPDEKTQPTRKYLLKENMYENVPSLLYFAGSDDELLKRLGVVFDNPKPVDLVKRILTSVLGPEDIVMDYFAGSCSTAHAVLDLNTADGGNRKFICVQLPVPLENQSLNPGCKSIADVGSKRIVRAIEEYSTIDTNLKSKLGFKYFKLEASVFKKWIDLESKPLSTSLSLFEHSIVETAQNNSILYEIILKSGFALNSKVDEITLQNHKCFSIAEGGLLVSLVDKLDQSILTEIATLKPIRFVALDSAFQGDDSLKTNTVQLMKSNGIEFRTV